MVVSPIASRLGLSARPARRLASSGKPTPHHGSFPRLPRAGNSSRVGGLLQEAPKGVK
jgi:hypothetical protein